MANLLLKIQGNKYINHTMFRPFLFIYDDAVIYKKRRKFLYVDEITATYNHMVQVNLHRGIFFAKLEIVNTGAEDISIKGVWKGKARQAKQLIDQKIYHAHNKDHHRIDPKEQIAVENFEKSLKRLKELLKRNIITKKEFEKKKKRLLKKIH